MTNDTIINDTIEQAIKDSNDIKILTYDPKVNFPDTVAPGTTIKFLENPEYVEWKQYDKIISVYALWYNQFDVPIKDLINTFLEKCKDIDLDKARFLPHVQWSGVIYYPVLIKDRIPARLICSYLTNLNAYQMSLDTIISTKSWCEYHILKEVFR